MGSIVKVMHVESEDFSTTVNGNSKTEFPLCHIEHLPLKEGGSKHNLYFRFSQLNFILACFWEFGVRTRRSLILVLDVCFSC